MSDKKLSDVVSITRQFQRSIHIDADLGKTDSLSGYICQGTAKSVLENTARQILETNQHAFTWTGPYGGGKSSLALGLCSIVYHDEKIRKEAIKVLGLAENDIVLNAFDSGKNGWLVLPVVGKRASVVQSLYLALIKAKGGSVEGAANVNPDQLLKLLSEESESNSQTGVLVVIDELGKFLESALQNHEDIYFYQQLAELANRVSGKLIIVGILHQAFEQYARKLGRNAREEWSKIQGRFVDIPLISATDELVELTGKALSSSFKHPSSSVISKNIAELIRIRRPSVSSTFWKSLDNCWPLHPATAALLGPTSKRRFGQNERSAFSFLVSVEPKGFKDFLLTSNADESTYYLPCIYWDYLKLNLEPAILASSDGHRWAQAAEAVERSEAKGENVHVQLTKTIAIIELFKNGSGLSSDDKTLQSCLPSLSEFEVKEALGNLKNWSIIAFRKHLGAWGVFAGSDFDIDGALHDALLSIGDPDLGQLTKLTNLYPAVAKRHYLTTGTLRWMNIELCHAAQIKQKISEYGAPNDAFGAFILCIPSKDNSNDELESICKTNSKSKSEFPVVLGAPQNGDLIKELSRELLGMEFVRKNRPEHEGDPIARREIDARISSIRNRLENELREAFFYAHWYLNGKLQKNPGSTGLSSTASSLADLLYSCTPHILNELVNRDKLSGTSSKARRTLLHAMIINEKIPNLGFDGYPAEAGLYYSLLKSVGIHKQVDEQNWAFHRPSEEGKGKSFQKAWDAAEKLLIESDGAVSMSDLYRKWSEPPYGIKNGVLPILSFAFVLANKANVALYKDGMFVPEISDVTVDEALQAPQHISLKYVKIDKDKRSILEGINAQLHDKLSSESSVDPLNTARALVYLMFQQPEWTKRTTQLSKQSRDVRDVLLRASDPHKVLFVDLPMIFGVNAPDGYKHLLGDALKEITTAYELKLEKIISKMLIALDADLNDIESIKSRAKIVSGITGDFLLDGFAGRLSVFEKTRMYYEGLCSLAVSKPPRDWNDQDADLALITLADWSLKFRQFEAIASVRDRNPTRKAIAVVFGTGDDGETMSESFNISKNDQPIVDKLAATFMSHSKSISKELFLAALAQAGVDTLHGKGITNE